jgi:hypothetical protein
MAVMRCPQRHSTNPVAVKIPHNKSSCSSEPQERDWKKCLQLYSESESESDLHSSEPRVMAQRLDVRWHLFISIFTDFERRNCHGGSVR